MGKWIKISGTKLPILDLKSACKCKEVFYVNIPAVGGGRLENQTWVKVPVKLCLGKTP